MGSRFPGRSGHGRPALPAGRLVRGQALGRRAPPRRPVQAAPGAARASAPRRADQPSRRRDDRLARRPSAQLSGRDPDRHPRPLLPRQRDGLDPRARPRPRHSLRGQLLVLARAEAEAHGAGGPRGRGAQAHHRARARVGVGFAQGPPGQVEGPYPALRGPRGQGQRERSDDGPDRHSHRRAPGQQRHRVRRSQEGLRRQASHRRPVLQASAGRHRRHHRPERRRQDHALPHDHRPGAARRRLDPDRRDA